jgi:hypothetical protein
MISVMATIKENNQKKREETKKKSDRYEVLITDPGIA